MRRRQTHKQRNDRGNGKGTKTLTTPVVVTEHTSGAVPQVTGNSAFPRFRLFLPGQRRQLFAFGVRQGGNHQLQLVQERVQIDRDKLCRTDTRQTFRVTQPARGVIPARLSTSTQVTIDFAGRTFRFARGFNIFHPRLITWRIAVIPVTVQQRAIWHPHDVTISLVWHQ